MRGPQATAPFFAALGALAAASVPPTATATAPFPPLPLHFSVADGAGRRAADGTPRADPRDVDAFLAAQLEAANRIFAPTGVRFRAAGRSRLPARHAVLDTRRDRHALGARVRPGVIHVFVVAFLRDVDEPDRSRQGVHWRPRGPDVADGAHLVVLAGYAGPGILAHELGHYLGNRRHSDVPGNVMSYDWAGRTTPVFDRDQTRRIRRFVRRALEEGAIDPRAVGPVSGTAPTGGTTATAPPPGAP